MSRLLGVLAAAVALAPLARGPLSPRFVESAGPLGVVFVHQRFATPEKHMHETMGSGVALFDANGDARLDLYLVQGAPTGPSPEAAGDRLLLQQPDGRFRDATAEAGLDGRGHGMGAAYGDVDADGDLDLYVTRFGPNALYRNRGDGRFEDVTAAAGVACPLWSTSAGFFDADGDGDLDLYVVNYVDFGLDNHKWCGDAKGGLRAYCHPDVYRAQPDVLYLNDGQGRFREAGPEARVPHTPDGKGLGVAFADLTGDGLVDVYVANDSTMNYLLAGDGRGRFAETALLAGAGFNAAGAAEAGMGVAIGDVDGDGRPEIFVTNLDRETNTLYRNEGEGLFRDATAAAGLAAPSLPHVGFGTVLFDHDADGDLDLFVANGHIIDNIAEIDPARRHAQPAQLFDNDGAGRFLEITPELGLAAPLVGRGAAAGDLDGDGDLDLVVTENAGPARVLLNRHGTRNRSLAVRLTGRRSNPHGIGAVLALEAGGRRQVRHAGSSSSYLSQGALDLHFGLASASRADSLEIRWPSGVVDRHGPLDAGYVYTITEGAREVSARPFEPRP